MNKKIKLVLFLTSFIPVTVFKVISRGGAGTLEESKRAILLGFILAAVQIGFSRRFFKHTTYLERAFLGFLTVGMAWIFVAPPEKALLFARYSTFLLYATLFLVTLLPQLFGYDPFTFTIAKQWYPESVTKAPQFLPINLRISYFWSGIFLAAAASCYFGAGRWPFTILLPFALILGVGLPFSRRYPMYYHKKHYAGDPVDPALLPDSARQLILEMPKVFRPEAAKEIRGEIQFDLSGEGGGQIVLSIEEGNCTAYEGVSPKPILRIKAPAEVWLKLARGEINRAQALMKGMFTAEGDIVLLTRLGEIFKRTKNPSAG
jgi:putative sterol carrier protein